MALRWGWAQYDGGAARGLSGRSTCSWVVAGVRKRGRGQCRVQVRTRSGKDSEFYSLKGFEQEQSDLWKTINLACGSD